jgi:hypothetical protein
MITLHRLLFFQPAKGLFEDLRGSNMRDITLR